jgi:transcriptional regulator with GAF, ATPase, and Fis domain/tetratricopeptide (TPR) repeat protein/serine/threonine protein kinase
MKLFVPDRFGVIRILREDDNSKTFLATDHLSERTDVLVKIVRKGHFNPSDRLIQQFSWFAGIRHSNLSLIFDAGLTIKADFFCVREYLRSSELFSIDNVTALRTLLSVVELLRSNNRIHGAIKPSNIFFSDECLKLADPSNGFRHAEDDIRFSAPENLRGEPTTLESDLYSVGAVLYRVLTRRNIFEDVDRNHLKAKCLWAAPLPIENLPDIPKPVSVLIMQLLDKNPKRRTQAFVELRQYLGIEPLVATRPPFVGRDHLLDRTLSLLRTKVGGLKVVIVEGRPGIGKSRFIEELQLRGGFEGWLFLKSSGARKYKSDQLHAVGQIIRQLSAHLSAPPRNPDPDLDSPEKTTDDIVELFCSVARRLCVVLTIEDIDNVGSQMLRFIERLSTRAIPLSILLTCRRWQSDSKLNSIFSQRHVATFNRICLPPLNDVESNILLRYLESSSKRHSHPQQFSGGNPLLLEEQCKSKNAINSDRVKEALTWMRSQLTKETKPLAEALSLLKRPVELEIIANITGQNITKLYLQVKVLESVGLIQQTGSTISLAYPLLSKLIYKGISRQRKVALAKRTYQALNQTDRPVEDLAYYAFEGQMFEDAATLYQRLAIAAHDSRNSARAVAFYQLCQKCHRQRGFDLSPEDKANLARDYDMMGNHLQSRALCRQLLVDQQVLANPELLSRLYLQLSMISDKSSLKERLRFSRMAFECLPTDSLRRSECLALYGTNLIRVGDLAGASEALHKADECATSARTSKNLLEAARAALLMNTGDFIRAIELLSRSHETQDRGFVLNNLGFCFSRVGDLRKACDFYSQCHDWCVTSGFSYGQVLSLANLGDMKMKLGEMGEAAQLFDRAVRCSEQLRKKDPAINPGLFISMLGDAALQAAQTGKYRRSRDYLKRIRSGIVGMYEIDKLYCIRVQCLLHHEIGMTREAVSFLEEFRLSPALGIPFHQVEHTLLEARILDGLLTEQKLQRLQDALETASKLGTFYQQCEVLNELAALLISIEESRQALEYTKTALRLAKRNGYKLLGARALLLAGIASEKQHGKERKLLASFQNAAEMGLLELVAESAFYVGQLHLESGNLLTSREFLGRSVSITNALAEEVPVAGRRTYLAISWRRDARMALERCNLDIQRQPSDASSFDAEGSGRDQYFKAAYRFALAGAGMKSAEALVTQIENTLRISISRGAVIVLKEVATVVTRPVRIKATDELLQRVRTVAAMAKNRPYFGSVQKETVAWIPLQSETREGGIYVVCRHSEPPLSEREMELFAIIGTIANGALRGLETNQANDLENEQLAEFHGMAGASKAIREVYSQVQIAAKNAATVLIEGESGTGKELVAKAIHAVGQRAKEPFIAVDCGAIPEGLIEAELFGAKKGSYTGAIMDRAGLFEAANRGTIFLDEISNTTPALQAKLLRVIQERQVRRIGETKDRPIDVRLIVASNANLDTLVVDGKFRKDLLYRLKVLHIKVPPLRSRREDIPMLAHSFLQKLNAMNKQKKYFAPGILNQLAESHFPGNVRELQNAVERAFFSAKGSVLAEVPLESSAITEHDDVQAWFRELSEGRKDFWSAIHNRYKRRDISREKVIALVDLGLRATHGSYKTLASKFHLKENDYRRFMDFLRRNNCLLDFRPYRKSPDA